MFLLSTDELSGISLNTISRIDITFYKFRHESFNIFNIECDFDENLIPLATSILECQPILIKRKTYIGLDSNYIIEYPASSKNDLGINLGEYCLMGKFPSFQVDIEAFNNVKSKQKSYWQSHKIHSSQVYHKSQELVRIYSRDSNDSNTNKNTNTNMVKCNIFNPQDTFGCKEEWVICWRTQWGGFELCIRHGSKKCIWHLAIDVIEDNNFIDSKIDAVNTWLEKIHKLKSTIKIANQ
jgi:hypothetical protein